MSNADNRILKSIAAGAALFSAGGMATVSLMTIPAFLDAAAGTAQMQFRRIYSIGLLTQPPVTATTTGLMGYLWYIARTSGQNRIAKIWLAAAVAMGAILPFTLGFLERVSWALQNYRVPKASDSSTPTADLEIRRLLHRWNSLNMVRTTFALSAGLFSLAAIVSR